MWNKNERDGKIVRLILGLGWVQDTNIRNHGRCPPLGEFVGVVGRHPDSGC